MNLLKSVLILCIINSSFAQSNYSPGVNSIDSIIFNTCNDQEKITYHSNFTLQYDEHAEQSQWVAYRLTESYFNQSVERSNDFREDSTILTGSAELEDYRGSGYDRGHLAPAGSMRKDFTSMSESFLMSNISPQLPSFNRGIWKRLEEKIRFWSEKFDSLLVISGPILDNPIDTIGSNKVLVPNAYFKTIIAFKGKDKRGIAFLLPHESSSASLYSFATSIDHIEELKEYDFYCNLSVPDLETIEANDSVKFFLFGKK